MLTFATHRGTFAICALVATLIASSASVVNLTVLSSMTKHWTGYLSLLATMTSFQLAYDVSFYSGIVNTGSSDLTIVSNVIQLFSGLTASFVSNLVAFIAFYVVYFKKVFPINKHYSKMLACVIVVAIVDCSLYILSQADSNHYDFLAQVSVLYIYYYLKLVSIAVNFILVLTTAVVTRQMNSHTSVTRTRTESSLNKLSLRLFFYPIVQLLSRSGCAWYELVYHFEYHKGRGFTFDPPHTSNLQFGAQLTMALSMPIASVGYLIIFLVMQPKAYANFRRIFFGVQGDKHSPSIEHHVELQHEQPQHSLGSFSHSDAVNRPVVAPIHQQRHIQEVDDDIILDDDDDDNETASQSTARDFAFDTHDVQLRFSLADNDQFAHAPPV